MREVIGAAVLKTLDENTRATVISTAITHLLKPEKTYNGITESPLQQAFNRAIENIAEKMAMEEIENNEEVKSKLRTLLHEAVDTLMANKDESVKKIAAALASAMTKAAALGRTRSGMALHPGVAPRQPLESLAHLES